MKTLTYVLILLIASCTAPRKITTGRYTVASKTGDVVTLKEVKGQYIIASDTLKAGDQITINVIKPHH